ncbi:MAG: nucleotidyltransferase domain-containing protein [Lachnospiraceae bacterium]|nr:nucleotidyltransferase domain-containing protein [Lachnospiraceae bacterium]
MNEYYSVTEYAKLKKKDPGNIRRMLINGRLEGFKIGKQWVISKDTPYPEDSRLKSGDYRNWRTKTMLYKEHPLIMKSLSVMCKQMQDIYGELLDRVIMYGSYVRGEQTKESDIDIALILKKEGTEEIHNKMVDLVVDYELDLNVTLSVVPLEAEQYKEWRDVLPFYKNIDKEGVILWKNA